MTCTIYVLDMIGATHPMEVPSTYTTFELYDEIGEELGLEHGMWVLDGASAVQQGSNYAISPSKLTILKMDMVECGLIARNESLPCIYEALTNEYPDDILDRYINLDGPWKSSAVTGDPITYITSNTSPYIINRLVENGSDVNFHIPFASSLLAVVSEPEAFRVLMKHGIDLNYVRSWECIPLIYIIFTYLSADAVEVLLSGEVDLTRKSIINGCGVTYYAGLNPDPRVGNMVRARVRVGIRDI